MVFPDILNYLILKKHKFAIVFSLFMAAGTAILLVNLWQDYKITPSRPKPISPEMLQPGIAFLQFNQWVEIDITGLQCQEMNPQSSEREKFINGIIDFLMGGEALREHVILSNEAETLVLVAMFSKEVTCREVRDNSPLRGVISRQTFERYSRLTEIDPVLAEYAYDGYIYNFCAFCGRGNTLIGLIVCAVLFIISIGLLIISIYLMKEKSQEKKIDIESLLNQTEDNSLLIQLGQHLFNKYYKNGFDNLTKPEQIIFMIDQLEMEINNGGFAQYYGNSGSDYAQDVPFALESIGASYTADLVRKGNSLFPNGLPPKIWPDRQVLLDNIINDIHDQLDELDNLFYEYKDPLGKLQREYIHKYKEHFS